MARKKANNRMLVILLALIAVVCVALWYADKVEREGKAAAAAEQPADEAAEAAAATLAGEGAEAPDFTVTMFDGSQVTLSELRGKVVLLNFWATWCPPCRKEMTRVGKDIIERFAGRDFVFLPVSRGEGRSAVGAFREKNGYDFPMGLDSTKAVFGLYASNYIPRNFLIDREGKVVLASVDYDDEEFDTLLRAIEKTLENQTR
mgnify:CR=1 FL=1